MQQIGLFLHLLKRQLMLQGNIDRNNDDVLLQGCLKHDRKAQRALYEKYSSRMFSVCLRYSGSREDAMDLLQEGFITVFTKIDTFTSSGSLEGWLRRIFVNTALMKLRRNDVLKDAADVVTVAREAVSTEDVLSGISRKDIMRMISEMPEGFRTVFNMSVMDGFTHPEIAKALGISEGTSRSQLSRARMWLQERLREWKRK